MGTALALLGAAGAAGAATGTHHHHHKLRPDLTVTAGSVSLTGSTLAGSFVVKDKGHAKAKKSSATLDVVVSGQPRPVSTLSIKKLRPKKSQTVAVSAAEPSGLPTGTWPLTVCADSGSKVKEQSEKNNCRTVGQLVVAPPPPPPPPSTVPTDPLPYEADNPFHVVDSTADYWADIPSSYPSDQQTPTTLFVWLDGTGGSSAGDIYDVSPGQAGGSQDWISMAVGGAHDGAWDVNTDSSIVLAAIADMKTHFNINPRRVIIGGYSLGGDLAYRTIFYNANTFAGIVAENTAPFRDTGSTQAQSLAAAAWKFNVAHLAHNNDSTYPIAEVQNEINAMKNAGFPNVNLIQKNGTHSDSHTVPDLQAILPTYLDAGWLSP